MVWANDLVLEGPVDMDFGPDGDLYILEYGLNPFMNSPKAVLSKIKYNAGNRKPKVQLSADKLAGSSPLNVELSSAGTIDPDSDPLKFQWEVIFDGQIIKKSSESNFNLSLSKFGSYDVVLTITDDHEESDSRTLKLSVGNAPPIVEFDLHGANRSFYYPETSIDYSVQVEDKEDGNLNTGEIDAKDIEVQIDYVQNINEFRKIVPKLMNASSTETINTIIANQLMDQSDCKICHKMNQKSLGPAFVEIAKKYEGPVGSVDSLIYSVSNGSVGKWGAETMPAHTTMSTIKIKQIVDYIFTLNEQAPSFEINGNLEFNNSQANQEDGRYVFRAFYTDKGADGVPPLSTIKVLTLRNPKVSAKDADILHEVDLSDTTTQRKALILKKDSSFIAFKNIDLTGIKQILFNYSSSATEDTYPFGTIEIKLNNSDGFLIGKTDNIYSSENSKKIAANIQVSDGLYDIYFVFRKNTSDKKLYIKLWDLVFKNDLSIAKDALVHQIKQ